MEKVEGSFSSYMVLFSFQPDSIFQRYAEMTGSFEGKKRWMTLGFASISPHVFWSHVAVVMGTSHVVCS